MRQCALWLIVSLSGCAAAQKADCGGDWFNVGKRDGRMAFGSQIERYAERCGVPVDVERYEAGYNAGLAERPRYPLP